MQLKIQLQIEVLEVIMQQRAYLVGQGGYSGGLGSINSSSNNNNINSNNLGNTDPNQTFNPLALLKKIKYDEKENIVRPNDFSPQYNAMYLFSMALLRGLPDIKEERLGDFMYQSNEVVLRLLELL